MVDAEVSWARADLKGEPGRLALWGTGGGRGGRCSALLLFSGEARSPGEEAKPQGAWMEGRGT